MSKRWFVITAVLLGLAVRAIVVLRAHGMLIDDAWISLRYGRNLWSGHGLVFNPGEAGLGAPPLWAALSGLVWRLTRALPGGEAAVGYAVSALNLAIFAAATFLLGRLPGPRGTGQPPAVLAPFLMPYLPVLLLAVYLPFVDNGTTGMETPLFLLLLLGSLAFFRAGRVGWASACLAGMLLVRAEGAVWSLAAVVAVTRARGLPRPTLRRLGPGLAIAGTWAIVSTLVYGSPIPLNVLSKTGWLVRGGDNAGASSLLVQAWDVLRSFTLLPFGLVHGGALAAGVEAALVAILLAALAAFVLGARALWQERSPDLAFALFFVGVLAFYVVGRGATWPSWYAIPPGLAFYVVVGHGIAAPFATTFAGRRTAPDARGVVPAVAARTGDAALAFALAVLVVTGLAGWVRLRAPYYRLLATSYGATGRYLEAHAAPDDSLLVWEVGYIGFLEHRYTQEVAGIVSPRVFQLRHRDPAAADTRGLIGAFHPRFVVLPTRGEDLADPAFREWFARAYAPVFESLPYTTFQRR